MRLARAFAVTIITMGLFLVLMQTAVDAQDPGKENTKPFILLAAGDIAECDSEGSSQTAAQIQAVVATRVRSSAGISVAALGDNAYEEGSITNYLNCYAPTWGRFLTRTLPVVGNHEYLTPDAGGYVEYFGAAAGDPAKLYYSVNLPNNWLFVALNSNCSQVGGCDTGAAAGGVAARRCWPPTRASASLPPCTSCRSAAARMATTHGPNH